MTAFLAYLVALVVALTGLLFTFLMVIMGFIIAALVMFANLLLFLHASEKLAGWINKRIFKDKKNGT